MGDVTITIPESALERFLDLYERYLDVAEKALALQEKALEEMS